MKKITNGMKTAARGLAGLVVVSGVTMLMAGCTTAVGSGRVVAVTERGFGIKIAQQTQNQTPEIALGFFSSTVELIPTATNAVLNTPDFANTFAIGQSGAPFVFDVNETTASGRMMTGAGTNIASQPIVPK